MTVPIDHSRPRFDGEACYKIVVQGSIPHSWEDRLAGMKVVTTDEECHNISVLRGIIRDQAELNGILETLYRLQLTILSVKRQTT